MVIEFTIRKKKKYSPENYHDIGKITVFNRKYIFIHGGFSIVMLVFGVVNPCINNTFMEHIRPKVCVYQNDPTWILQEVDDQWLLDHWFISPPVHGTHINIYLGMFPFPVIVPYVKV